MNFALNIIKVFLKLALLELFGILYCHQFRKILIPILNTTGNDFSFIALIKN